MNLLINPDDISLLAREIFIDDKKANLAITEAEDIDVRPVLGDALINYIKTHRTDCRDLLDGGTYSDDCGLHIFGGLKKAIAYYTYSRLIVAGDVEVTRSGIRSRDSEYSHQVDTVERQQVSRECNAIAARIMNDTIGYINSETQFADFLPCCGLQPIGKTRVTCKIIGD